MHWPGYLFPILGSFDNTDYSSGPFHFTKNYFLGTEEALKNIAKALFLKNAFQTLIELK